MPGEVLVLNCGSSSVKFSLFEPHDDAAAEGAALLLTGQVDGIGTPHPHGRLKDGSKKVLLEERWPSGDGPKDHDHALGFVVAQLGRLRPGCSPRGVGHRVVHGGVRFRSPTRLDGDVRAYLESLV